MSKKDFWTKRLLSKRTWNRITNNSIKESNASIVNLISKQMDGCHPIVTLSFLFKDSSTYRLSPLTEKKKLFSTTFLFKKLEMQYSILCIFCQGLRQPQPFRCVLRQRGYFEEKGAKFCFIYDKLITALFSFVFPSALKYRTIYFFAFFGKFT